MLKYSLYEWEMHGLVLFGKEKRKWYFQCPNCFHIQSVQEFLKEGYPPDLAYSYCRTCHYKAKQGTFGKGKIVQVNQNHNLEVFDFA
ncbi:VVA0879 family protein [Pseudalkalibacillus sp. Hm43]|uniref:VVA0879 family protein n=1 Tax=Pseudalkalibacillus sp. Hm43 TaxID=3450742 RepID=UPI003F440D30